MTPEPSADEREPARLEAFSDGVLAVIITIMAFNLQVPAGTALRDLRHSMPSVLTYILSFTYIGIYWNNHHHLLRATRRINGVIMWANLHLLFWLSLMPVVTKWVADQYKSSLPASVYGGVAFGSAVAFTILLRAIVSCNGEVARAVGRDWKGKVSLVIYAAGVASAWITPWISYVCYAAVAVMWFVPDRRLDRRHQAAGPVPPQGPAGAGE